ncbi:MAG: hypothetical protein FWH53_03195 [Leptospirales bacterium]|nr:hypothetical protein [Leptospirales bacterium]
MKKKIMISVFFLGFALCAFAQEEKMSAGLGLEWNMNSKHNFAGGANLGFYYNLPGYVALGFTVTGSTNFSGFHVIEPTALLRYYFLEEGYERFFIQIDTGPFIILEDGETRYKLEGGCRVGYRLPLNSSIYVEPYGRLGYPFAFGLGVMAGMYF